ncbi:MAG: S8 family peptidase [Opitutales bacterium]
MTTFRALCILGLVLGAWLAYFMGVGNSLRQSSTKESVSPSTDFQLTRIGHGQRGPKHPQALSKLEDASQTEDFEAFLEKVNPGNDWLVTLGPNQTQSILKDPSAMGLTVQSYLPELGVTRFSVTNPSKALPFFERFLQDDQISLNHPLRSPLPPRDLIHSDESSFSDSFIDWMGGEVERTGFGKGVKLALLDSGVNSSHPLLNGAVVRHKNILDNSSSLAGEGNAHGTALASVIAGSSDTYQGIAPACEILSYQVIDGSGLADSFTVARAVVAAVEDGAGVINLSLGAEQGSAVLRDAITYAISRDVVVVAATGNEGVGIVNYPAAYDGVIGVSSIGTSGRVPSFSNYGKEVDIAAPGVGVLTAWDNSDRVSFSGTSISTAMVSAALAVERSRYPELSSAQIIDSVLSHTVEAERPGFDPVSGHGVLSLARLDNRKNSSYSDPALVGYHFDNPSNPMGTIFFEVMVQNLGNTWQDNLDLELKYLGLKKNILINNLAPGEVRAEKIFIQGSTLDRVLEINANLRVPQTAKDDRPDNNQRNSVIQF